MIPTRRTLRTTAATTLLAAAVLAGCADEEPTSPTTPTSAAPAPTSEAPTTEAPDEAAVTTEAPADDAAATTAPAQDVATATEDAPDELTAGDGSFTVALPEGWEEVTDVAREGLPEDQQEAVVLAAREVERKDDFFTNIVVTREEYVSNLTSAVEDTAQELAGEDGEYELLDPVEVDGNRAPGYTVIRDVQGTTVHQTQHWVSHDGTLYSVTLSAVEPQAEDAAQVLADVMASWAWQD